MKHLFTIKSIATMLVVGVMTSSCAMYSLEELRNTASAGDAFQTALSKRYMDFATEEEKDYDWASSWHFADKGLMLAYGKDMPPEDLNNWSIPEDVLPALEKARAQVLAVLTPENMKRAPERTADVQFYFDCWVEQQEENWQVDDIAFCRDHLMHALEGFASASTPSKAKSVKKTGSSKQHESKEVTPIVPVTKPVPEAAKAKPVAVESPAAQEVSKELVKEPTKEAAKESTKEAAKEAVKEGSVEAVSYAVFFEAGKAQLSVPGQNVVSEVVDSLKNIPSYEIILHTAATKNMTTALATERAQVVKSRLVTAGVPEKTIKLSGAAEDASKSGNAQRIDLFLNE